MATKRFNEQMQAYGQWKRELIASIERYQEWLDANELGTPEGDLRIFETLESLRSDRLTVAFVAEFARGKTELINAIFFSEYDRRLLPSEAGRTTMCPTELFYDSKEEKAYIRMLPIETRLTDSSIAEYKQDPIHWTNIDLDLQSPENMAEAFREIVRVKTVSTDEAHKLGLYSEADVHLHQGGVAPKEIEIPVWRHAMISFPHPLLKQGLVILDTPGLNAIGSEPELTMNMLPKAQAVVFILAADTGVTKSDLDMWKHNVKPLRSNHDLGLMVVMNKVDTLWDELKSEAQVHKTIGDQCQRAAETLGIKPDRIFPASAQKGLLAKIRHDQELLRRSNILSLEEVLATEILPHKQTLTQEHVREGIGGMVDETFSLLASRVTAARRQLEELRGLSGKNNEVIEHLMKTTREEQVAYYKNVESFQANKKLLSEQSKKLLELLSISTLDKLVSETRKVMTDSWTTHGLKIGMKTFFDGVRDKMQEVNEYSEQLNRLVLTVYRKFQQEHGIGDVKPALFTTARYVKEFGQLYQEAENFRSSPMTTMTEQSIVIKKFFITLVSHARNVFFKARTDAEAWSKAVMTPLVNQIKEHKEHMERRLENLRKINESRDTLQSRIEELEKVVTVQGRQAAEVKSILDAIHRPIEMPAEAEIPPAAAANG